MLAAGCATRQPPPSDGGADTVEPLDPAAWVTPDAEVPRVQHLRFHSEVVRTEVSAHVFVPAPYDHQPSHAFPVLYWLHGTDGGLPGVRHVTRVLSAAMRAGQIPPALIVFPHGLARSLWVDSADGRMPVETLVIEELIPHIDRTFRTLPAPRGRLLEGYSMGGYGAARWALARPQLFGAVSLLAPGPLQPQLDFVLRAEEQAREALLEEVFGGDLDRFHAMSPWRLAEDFDPSAYPDRPLFLQIGVDDEMIEVVRDFQGRLDALEIPHHDVEVPGVGHDAAGLLQAAEDAGWPFYQHLPAPTATP